MSVGRIQDEKSNLKVVSATLERAEGLFGNFGNGNARLVMTMENGTIEYLAFYDDEISMTPSDVTGKTLNEAWDVFYARDLAYLRG